MNYTEIDEHDDELLDLHTKLLMLRTIDMPVSTGEDLPEELHETERVVKHLKDDYVTAVSDVLRVNRIHDETRKKIDRLTSIIDGMGDGALRYKDDLIRIIEQFEKDEGLSELKDQYKESVAKFQNLRRIINFLGSDDMNRYMCFTCLERSIDTALVPCGHVTCSMCMNRLNFPVCPYCRAEFTTVKLFLG